jgi:hypothetical protein
VWWCAWVEVVEVGTGDGWWWRRVDGEWRGVVVGGTVGGAFDVSSSAPRSGSRALARARRAEYPIGGGRAAWVVVASWQPLGGLVGWRFPAW